MCCPPRRVPAALLFAPESAARLPETREVLRGIAEQLRALPSNRSIEVAGHTARYGTAAERQQLSEDRVQAVVDALVALQVPRHQLSSKGYGATRPKRPEILPDGTHDLEAARENRRVVITPR